MAQIELQWTEPIWARTTWPRWGKWILVTFIWSLPGLTALSYYYLNQIVTAQPMAWKYALISTIPNWYIWALLTPAIVWVGGRYRIERTNWKGMIFGVHLPIMLMLMLLHALINLMLFRTTGLHDELSTSLYRVHFTSRFHANVLAYWTILGVYYAYDYYRKYRSREQQAISLQLQLAQANLRALKMQLHPHFLFNTLNSVAALVRKNENKTAVKMLVQLSDFLRLALENKGVQEIPLKQELDFLERYLNIEKIRFKERLTFTVKATPDVQEAYVPNMVLQPLVENAIHHGIAPHAEAGQIEVIAHIEDEQLVMEVRDDGPGLPATPAKRTGVGLTNIRERLENLYGEEQSFELQNRPERGLTARIVIPFSPTPVMKVPATEFV